MAPLEASLAYLRRSVQRARERVYGDIVEALAHVPQESLGKLQALLNAMERDFPADGASVRLLRAFGLLARAEALGREGTADIEVGELNRLWEL
jgi:hypothetical protein